MKTFYYINTTKKIDKKTYLEAMLLKGGCLERKVGKFVPEKPRFNGFSHGLANYSWVRVTMILESGESVESIDTMVFMYSGTDGISFDPSPEKNVVTKDIIDAAKKYRIQRQKPMFGKVSHSTDFF